MMGRTEKECRTFVVLRTCKKGFNSAIEMMEGLIEMQDACFLSCFPLPVKFLPCWPFLGLVAG